MSRTLKIWVARALFFLIWIPIACYFFAGMSYENRLEEKYDRIIARSNPNSITSAQYHKAEDEKWFHQTNGTFWFAGAVVSGFAIGGLIDWLFGFAKEKLEKERREQEERYRMGSYD